MQVFDIGQIWFETLFFFEDSVCSQFTSLSFYFCKSLLVEDVTKSLEELFVDKRGFGQMITWIKIEQANVFKVRFDKVCPG